MIYDLLTLLTSAFTVAQSTFTKLSSRSDKTISIISFNMFKALAACILFGVISFKDFNLHIPTVLYSMLYGCSLLLSTIFGYLALMKGSMALTSLLCSYSIVIPCIFGIAYLDEDLGFFQYMGLALLFISMYLLRKKDLSSKFEKNWGVCVGVTFVCNGICSVIQKLHQNQFPSSYCKEFTFFSILFVFVVLLLVTVARREKQNITILKYSVPAGISMGLANYMTLFLSSYVDATILFPATPIFTILLNYIVSRLLFKDKFNKKQIFGIILGVISIIFIKR